MGPSLLIVAAEASADLHAAAVLDEVRRAHPDVAAFGMGGPRLRAAGLEALRRAEELGVLGLTEALPRIPTALAILRQLPAEAAARRATAALLVDSPDLNLPLARRLRRAGVPVVYYVAPMAWAWRRGRARALARSVERLLCILPFEERFFAGAGVPASFVGHPLAGRPPAGDPAPHRRALGLDPGRPTVALLPGSRRAEVGRLLPRMLAAAERVAAGRPGLQVVLGAAPTVPAEALSPALRRHPRLPVTVVPGAEAALAACDAALVKSGTAALEAAVAGRPMVVTYRLSWPTWIAARLLVRLSHAALPNLLAGRGVVPELLQGAATPRRLAAALTPLLDDGPARSAQLRELAGVRAALGPPGAAGRVAAELLRLLAPASPLAVETSPA